jgi:D-inositol-3-phosphate glycosyltransferase
VTTLVYDGAFASPPDPSVGVNGTNVYQHAVVEALLQYGSYDRYVFLSRTPGAATGAGAAAQDARVTFLGLDDLATIDDPRVVLFTPTPQLFGLIRCRSSARAARWIVSGVIHSLDTWHLPYLAMGLLHSDVDAADSLLCSSEAGRTALSNIYAGFDQASPVSLPVVPLGIDCLPRAEGAREVARRELGFAPEAVVFLYVGRFSQRNKADLWPMLRAFADATQHRPHGQLLLSGDDSQYGLAALIAQSAVDLQCADRVRVLPNPSEELKRRLLDAADVFVAPSDHIQETFGLSVAEAMAAGLPVIAADWSGYRELVVHGSSGFLVPTYWLPLDPELDLTARLSFFTRNMLLAASTVIDPEMMQHYIELLLDDVGLRLRLGAAAQRQARERFAWSVVIREYEAIWNHGLAAVPGLREHRSAFSRCPPHYPVQTAFGHYPTMALHAESEVTLTAHGRSTLADETPLRSLIGPNGACDAEAVTAVLQAVSAHASLSVRDVIAKCGLARMPARLALGAALKASLLALTDRESIAITPR